MMTAPSQTRWLEQVQQQRVIGVIRASQSQTAQTLAELAIAAGLHHIEITSNTPNFTAVIRQLRQQYPEHWIGAGTLTTTQTTAAAIASGAQFLMAPYFVASVSAMAQAQAIPYIPGALTPQEIGYCWQQDVAAVKVFPVGNVGGASYIRALQGPMGHIPMIPTGGVTLTNAPMLLRAGAIAVGLSTDLFLPSLVQQQQWDALLNRMVQFGQDIRHALASGHPPDQQMH